MHRERTIKSLEGKRVLVTGALGGIGKAVVDRIIEAKGKVLAVDINEGSDLILASGARPMSVADYRKVDMSDLSAVQKFFVEAAPSLTDLYGVVHTIGVAGPRGPIDELDSSLLPNVFATNVFSMFFLLNCAVPLLKQHGSGRIVAIGSVAGRLGYPNRSAYASTKWAIEGLAKSLAIELGPFNITVNSVSPGPVSGPPIDAAIRRIMNESGVCEADARQILTSQSAMGTLIEPQEIAETVHFLLSPAARHITGQSIGVDAGITRLN